MLSKPRNTEKSPLLGADFLCLGILDSYCAAKPAVRVERSETTIQAEISPATHFCYNIWVIKYLIFDFGGVILKHKATIVEDALAQIFPENPQQALHLFTDHRLALMTGKESSEQVLTAIKDQLGSQKSIEEIMDQWKSDYQKEAATVDRELLAYIEELKEKFPVYMLTDTIDTHDDYNKTRGIYDKFTYVFRSNIEGVSKLNNEAFDNVLQKIGAESGECLLIDDLPVNIERAQNLGFKALLYRDLTALKSDLQSLLS